MPECYRTEPHLSLSGLIISLQTSWRFKGKKLCNKRWQQLNSFPSSRWCQSHSYLLGGFLSSFCFTSLSVSSLSPVHHHFPGAVLLLCSAQLLLTLHPLALPWPGRWGGGMCAGGGCSDFSLFSNCHGIFWFQHSIPFLFNGDSPKHSACCYEQRREKEFGYGHIFSLR